MFYDKEMPRNPNKIDYSLGFHKNLSAFESLTDPRHPTGNLRHHFGEVIFMAFVSILCGINSYELMEEFCNLQKKWFKKYLSLPNGIPSYNTFSRIFQAIEPNQFSQCIAQHLDAIGYKGINHHIAIDGKALRGSRDQDHKHVHSVSAWACDEGITLAQVFVSEKSNEITAIPELLELLDIEGSVVTIDAIGSQTAIAKKIVDKRGNYALGVKENQKALYDEISGQFEYASKQLHLTEASSGQWSYAKDVEKSHGRLSTRQTVVCHNLEWMDTSIRERWENLNSIIMVQRDVIGKDNQTHSETSYYMSSLSNQGARAMQHFIRDHWRIENNSHWILDTVFKEDANQTKEKNSAKNYATMRRMALNLWNLEPAGEKKKSLPKRQLRALKDTDYLESILFSRM